MLFVNPMLTIHVIGEFGTRASVNDKTQELAHGIGLLITPAPLQFDGMFI
jgi:hypothetical protein